MRFRTIVYILMYLLCTLSVKAQHILYSILPVQEKLPTTNVNKVLVDTEGYVWMGTEDSGLYRNDGYSVSVFRYSYLSGALLQSNYVTCLAEDREKHRVYFGTKRGLYYIDKRNYAIQKFADERISAWSIDHILVGKNGYLWIAANNSVLCYDRNGKRIGFTPSVYKGRHVPVHYMYEDFSGCVWALQKHTRPLLFQNAKNYKGVAWPFAEGGPAAVLDIPGTKNKLWLSVVGKGLYEYDKSTGQYSPVHFSDGVQGIQKMAFDSRTKLLWCMTPTQIRAYKVLSPTSLQAVENMEQPMMLQNRDMALDLFGNAFVAATYPYSVVFHAAKYDAEKFVLPPLSFKDIHLASPAALSMKGHHVWFCQQRQGLYHFDTETRRLTRLYTNSGFVGGKVSPIIAHSPGYGLFFLVIDNHRIVMTHMKNGMATSTTQVVTMSKGSIVHSLEYDNGILWIGTTDGLYQYDISNKQLFHKLPNVGIVNVIQKQGRTLLLGTENNGMYVYHLDTGTMQRQVPNENVSYISVSHTGSVWLATVSGNLFRLTGEGKAQSMAHEAGLTGENITGLQTDSQGRVWILTQRRLYLFDEKSYGTATIEGNDRAIQLNGMQCMCKTDDGRFLIGGKGEISILNENILTEHGNDQPILRLSSYVSNDSIHLVDVECSQISLRPDERNVELFFSSLRPLYAAKTRIAYKYGERDKWFYLPVGQNRISFADLPKGHHTLNLRCTNANGQWSKKTLTLDIYREPAWYESTVAFFLYFLVAVSVAFFFIRHYLNRKKEKMADEQIQNCAKDVSELFNHLSTEKVIAEHNGRLDIYSLLLNIKKQLGEERSVRKEPLKKIKEVNEIHSLSENDEQFVNKALEYIERNINNSEYSVEQLSLDMGMERTGLYRKLMNVIGKSPVNLIRSTRLERAALLIKQGKSVSEAAYMSGFGTVSYMSRCFQKEFGMKPSEYAASCTNVEK